MEKWTFVPFKAFLFFARLSLIDQRVKLLLLPSMTKRTLFKPLATLFVTSNKGAALPVLAKFRLIPKEVRLSTEILKIMRVYTLRLVMLVVVRAPLSFKVKHVEVKVLVLRDQVMH